MAFRASLIRRDFFQKKITLLSSYILALHAYIVQTSYYFIPFFLKKKESFTLLCKI